MNELLHAYVSLCAFEEELKMMRRGCNKLVRSLSCRYTVGSVGFVAIACLAITDV